MKKLYLLAFSLLCTGNISYADQPLVNRLLNEYQEQGAIHANINKGKQLWEKKYLATTKPEQRSCTSCHTDNLLNSGRHIRTAKKINPLATSVNPLSLSNSRKIKKWFKRNCKWTMGRECTAQEKSDILAYLNQY